MRFLSRPFLSSIAALALVPVMASASALSDFVDRTQEYVTEVFDKPKTETPAEPAVPPLIEPRPPTAEIPPAAPIETPVEIPVAAPAETPPPPPPPPAEIKTEADGYKLTAPAQPEPVAAAPVPPVDAPLKAALANAYTNHPQIKAQREALKATDESVSMAVSGFRPDVFADFNKGRERSSTTGSNWSYANDRSRGLSVTQPIFNGGETLASIATAKQRVKAARAELSALEQQVLYNVVVAYTDLVEKQSVLALNQKNVDVLKQQLEATQARFDVGELTVTDVAQSTARLARAQSDERQALGDLEVSKATFKRTIGYDAPEKVDMPIVPNGLPSTLTEANSWAQDANPILEAARRSEQAAADNVYVRGSALLPDVTLQGTMSRASGGSTQGLRNYDNDAITLNLSIPIYQSGAEWARLREARNQAQQAKFNTLDTSESVTEGTARAWEDFNTASAIITSNESMVKATETALDGVRKENEFGVRTVLDVLDAEQEAFAARVNLVKAVRLEKVQAYRLLASVGRLTAQDLKLETNVPDPKEHYDDVKYQLLGL